MTTPTTTTRSSACPLDCPDLCSLEVEVEDGRLVRIDGTERNPLTGGFICTKVRKIAGHVYGDDRLRHPLIRVGPKGPGQGVERFRQASWDEALDVIAARIRQERDRHGGECILPFNYGGSNGHLTQESIDARMFRRLGASRLLPTFCAMPGGTAQSGLYGGMPGVALTDYVHARLIVLWGINPSATSIHLVPMIKRARAEGARLVVIDPRRIPLAGGADLHLPVRPGTDLPVALSIMNWLFDNGAADEEFLAAHTTGAEILRQRAAEWSLERAADVAGVPAADLERFARLYAESKPAVIRCGWGLERNRNGGSAVAAVLALPAVGGKFGVLGGGFSLSNGASWRLSREPAAAEPASAGVRAIAMHQLGRALREVSDPPISVLFVYNCNPVANAPRQDEVREGLMREDLFTVVHDQVHTDSVDYADVVLPATTFLEHRELRRGYGAMHMADIAPVIDRVGESRPNYEVFAELCRRLDLVRPQDPMTDDELVDAMIDGSPDGEVLRAGLAKDGWAERPGGAHPVLFVDAFPTTSDRKIHLVAQELDEQAPRGLYGYADDPATAEYPLALISPAMSRAVTSTFAQLIKGEVGVEMHPDDAAARGLADGDPVRIVSAFAESHTHAKVSRAMRPGVVCLPKGLWARHTANGATSSALAPDTEADLGRGACYNDARVEIVAR